MINRYIIQDQAIKTKALKTSVADPDPSMIKKNSKENLNSYYFVTFFMTFYFKKYQGPLVRGTDQRIRIRTKMSRIRNTDEN
jgi:hypothetical protein